MSYKKLVRDKIPQLIMDGGEKPKYRILNDFEYTVELDCKLEEEVKEFLTATSREKKMLELADILEVVYALAKIDGFSADQLDAIRSMKAQQRGKFDDKIYLEGMIEEE